MNADQHRKAKYVIAWLAKAENPADPEYPVARIKAERWPEVCAAIEANPDLSSKTIAERLGAELGNEPAESKSHATPITNRDTAPAGPVLSRSAAADRVSAIKAELASVTKPPIPANQGAIR